MADNVAITAGSGTDIATDQVTTTNEHVQLFKLAYSADGSRTLVPADINGLLAQLRVCDVYGGGTQTGTADQSVMAAAASNYNYLCWVTVYNSSSTNTYANVKDNTTVRAVIPLPAYGGALVQFARPLKAGAANTAWNVAAGAGVTTAHFYGGGYQSTV